MSLSTKYAAVILVDTPDLKSSVGSRFMSFRPLP